MAGRGHLFRDPSTSLEQNSWWPQPQDSSRAPWTGGRGGRGEGKESTNEHVAGEEEGREERGAGKEREK